MASRRGSIFKLPRFSLVHFHSDGTTAIVPTQKIQGSVEVKNTVLVNWFENNKFTQLKADILSTGDDKQMLENGLGNKDQRNGETNEKRKRPDTDTNVKKKLKVNITEEKRQESVEKKSCKKKPVVIEGHSGDESNTDSEDQPILVSKTQISIKSEEVEQLEQIVKTMPPPESTELLNSRNNDKITQTNNLQPDEGIQTRTTSTQTSQDLSTEGTQTNLIYSTEAYTQTDDANTQTSHHDSTTLQAEVESLRKEIREMTSSMRKNMEAMMRVISNKCGKPKPVNDDKSEEIPPALPLSPTSQQQDIDKTIKQAAPQPSHHLQPQVSALDLQVSAIDLTMQPQPNSAQATAMQSPASVTMPRAAPLDMTHAHLQLLPANLFPNNLTLQQTTPDEHFLSPTDIRIICQNSVSHGNFAKNLVFSVYPKEDRVGRNCTGRVFSGTKQKLPLCQRRLQFIRNTVFSYFPTYVRPTDRDAAWKNCIKSIDKGLRRDQDPKQ